MLTIRAIVGIIEAGSDLSGLIVPDGPVPVTMDFDPRLPPIGRAVVSVDGLFVQADLTFFSEAARDRAVGLVPCIGGRQVGAALDVFEISLCVANRDPRVPPLDGGAHEVKN